MTLPVEQVLAELESQVLAQEEALGYRDFDAIDRSAERIDELLALVAPQDAFEAEGCRERLAALQERSRRLSLSIALEKQDVRDRLQRLRAGKGAVRSYGQDMSK